MPVSVEEYRIAQLYMIQVRDFLQSHAETFFISFQVNEIVW